MKPPEFTLWPWKLLALVVPLVAVGAGFAALREPTFDKQYLSVVVLGVLSAGNAYILAIASGSLARLAVAVPVGAAMGFLPLLLQAWTPFIVVYLAVLFVWSFLAILEWGMTRLDSVFRSCSVMILFAAVILAFFIFLPYVIDPDIRSAPVTTVLFSFPLLNACVAACMAAHTRYTGATDALLDSLTPSLKALAGCLPILLFVLPAITSRISGEQNLVFLSVILPLTNYCFIGNFFSHIVRDVPEQHPADKVPPDKLDKPMEEQEKTRSSSETKPSQES
jgi:hypothetical protein